MGTYLSGIRHHAGSGSAPDGRPLYQRALHFHEGSGDILVLWTPQCPGMECWVPQRTPRLPLRLVVQVGGSLYVEMLSASCDIINNVTDQLLFPLLV